MSPNFSKVKKYYDNKLWDITRVKNADIKGSITEEELKKITNTEYVK